MTTEEQSQEQDGPFAGFSPTMWFGYIHQEGGEEALGELLDQLSDPTPEFIDDILTGLFGTTIEHDRTQMRESILPAIVSNFEANARELEDIGLVDAANVLKDRIAYGNNGDA
jgi:hypothetical protein